MKVILINDVPKLGKNNTIVEVSNGYAMNFLFPQKQAIPYNQQNLVILNARLQEISQTIQNRDLKRTELINKLDGKRVEVVLKTHNGKPIGGFNNGLLVKLIKKKYQIDIEREWIVEHDSLHTPGTFTRTIKINNLHKAVIFIEINLDK